MPVHMGLLYVERKSRYIRLLAGRCFFVDRLFLYPVRIRAYGIFFQRPLKYGKIRYNHFPQPALQPSSGYSSGKDQYVQILYWNELSSGCVDDKFFWFASKGLAQLF